MDEYIGEYAHVYAESTVKDRRREFARIGATVQGLHERGMLSTDDPALMTVADIAAVAAEIRDGGCSLNTRVHMMGRLGMLCRFCGNMAADQAKARYPALFPSKRETRLGILTGEEVESLYRHAECARGFRELRAAVSVVLPLASGIRPQETRFVRDRDLSDDLAELTVSHPKGMGTYGEVRTVPVHPRAVPVLERYLEEFHGRGLRGYLFQGPGGEPVAGNTQRMWRCSVSEASGVVFDHRVLRRTWGQGLLDAGVSEQEVSVLLGHASTVTTAKYYARTRQDGARDAARRAWGRLRGLENVCGSGLGEWEGRCPVPVSEDLG